MRATIACLSRLEMSVISSGKTSNGLGPALVSAGLTVAETPAAGDPGATAPAAATCTCGVAASARPTDTTPAIALPTNAAASERLNHFFVAEFIALLPYLHEPVKPTGPVAHLY